MVQFCPRCGTRAPDDESVFCNRCGARLPPVAPVKKESICPQCGAKLVDETSAFCNKCGSPVRAANPAGVRLAPEQPAPVAPAAPVRHCRSCGIPLAEGNAEYCDTCFAFLNRPGPTRPVPISEPPAARPHPPVPDLADPVGEIHPPGEGTLPGKRGWKRYLAIGIAAILLIGILVAAGVFLPGMMKGGNTSINSTPAETEQTPVPIPTITTQITAAVTTRLTTLPVTTTATVTATPEANVPATGSVNASVTPGENVTTTGASNGTWIPPTPASNLNSTQAFSIGQAATDGKGQLTVDGISWKDKLSDPIPSFAIGKKYLIISITYQNLQNTTAEVSTQSMTLKDGGGYGYDQASDILLENPFNGKAIQPQEKRSGNLLFIVPPQATFLKLGYDFGNGNMAAFQLN